VQAQTVANFYLAFAQGLTLVPVLNKVDLPHADPPRVLEQMRDTFELDPAAAVLVSAKTGLNVQSLLPTVVEKIPPPVGNLTGPLRMLLVDSWYDVYKGVILLVRIFDGQVRPGDTVRSFATGLKYIVGEVGIMYPDQTPQTALKAGQVGYMHFNPGHEALAGGQSGRHVHDARLREAGGALPRLRGAQEHGLRRRLPDRPGQPRAPRG
jgi:translation elongation factor EF-4